MDRGAVLLLLVLVCGGGGSGGVDGATESVDVTAVGDLAGRIAATFKEVACETLRTGVGCPQPGLQDRVQDLQREQSVYKEEKFDMHAELLKEQGQPKIQHIFHKTSDLLKGMRDDYEMLVANRYRIASLNPRNRSELPAWDATNPRFLDDELTTFTHEGRTFNKRAIKESNVKYPPYSKRDRRKEMIAGNTSKGLEETWLENLFEADYWWLRWQRFVSSTGLTRQFPAAYDGGDGDNRLEPWYLLATQTPKRVVILLDLSNSMHSFDRFTIGVTTVQTLLSTLIPADWINVVFIDDVASMPTCFDRNLVPATPANLLEIQRFVDAASIGASDDKLVSAMAKAILVLEETDSLMGATNASKCNGYDCVPLREFVIVVSDGEVSLTDENIVTLGEMSAARALLHTMSVAVGPVSAPAQAKMRSISCAMNGLYFSIPPINHAVFPAESRRGEVSHPSYVLNRMSEYFQLLAAPIARNHTVLDLSYTAEQSRNLSVEITWGLPRLEPDGSAVTITLALPVFGDALGDLPRLLGVVSVDLVFFAPGEGFQESLIADLFGIGEVEPSNVLFESMALVYKQDYEGRTLVDDSILDLYMYGVHSMDDFILPGHHDFAHYHGGDETAQMQPMLTERSGTAKLTVHRRLDSHFREWDLQSLDRVSFDVTASWLHIPDHPFVLILFAAGYPDAKSLNVKSSISPPLNVSNACPSGVSGTSPCWSLPASNVLLPRLEDPTYPAPPDSQLFFSYFAYQDTALLLRDDSPGLPPRCVSTSSCPGFPRLRRLMDALNRGGALEGNLTGGGLLPAAASDAYWTSLVDALWRTADPDVHGRSLVRHVVVATAAGVMRVRFAAGHSGAHPPPEYSPRGESWFTRPLGAAGELVLTPPRISILDANPAAGKPILMMSQAIRKGLITKEESHAALSLAAVIAAELNHSAVHELLYGQTRLRGYSGIASSFGCGDTSTSGETRCFLIDSSGVLLTHPDRASEGKFWGSGAVFFGLEEPSVMQELVNAGFMKLVLMDHDVGVTGGGLGGVRAYKAEVAALPIDARRLAGVVTGILFVSKLPGIQAYLVVVSQYVDRAKAIGCGILSASCPSAPFPAVVARNPQQTCDNESGVTMAPQRIALLPTFSAEKTLAAFQMVEICPAEGVPSWVVPLIFGGLGVLAVILLLIALNYVHYKRKRTAWIATWVSAEIESDGTSMRHASADAAPMAKSLNRAEEEVVELFRGAQILQDAADSLDDYRTIIEHQSHLIVRLRERKALSRDYDDHRVEALALQTANMRLLACNLGERLAQHEHLRVQNSLQVLQGEVGALDKQLALLEKQLEEMMLPAVSIGEGGLPPATVASNHKEYQDEKEFYSAFYPHLFHFQPDAARQKRFQEFEREHDLSNLPVSARSRNGRYDPDATDRSEMSEAPHTQLSTRQGNDAGRTGLPAAGGSDAAWRTSVFTTNALHTPRYN